MGVPEDFRPSQWHVRGVPGGSKSFQGVSWVFSDILGCPNGFPEVQERFSGS